ncbi:MAG: fibronectin type III domain-containing protein [Bacteroidota bacterium]
MIDAPAPHRPRSAASVAPTPAEPVRGAVAPLDAVTFRWTAPPGASSFDLRVAAASAPTDPLLELAGLPTTETTLAADLPAGELIWWVRRSGGAWSAPATFRAGTPADIEAALRTEAEAADQKRAAEREARRIPTVEPLPEAPPAPVWPYATGEAIDGAAPVDWATLLGFGAPTREGAPPAEEDAPRVTGPLGGEVVDAVSVSLRWTPVPRATGYEVELSPHATFDRDVLTLDAGQTTEIALPGLVPAAGQKLLWRVRARLGARATPWSKYGRFYPAGDGAADQFRASLDEAVAAQRRQRDHARLVKEREMDLVPEWQREDAFTTPAMLGTVLGVVATLVVIGIVAVILALVMT